MSSIGNGTGRSLMTSVVGSSRGGNGGGEVLGEIESAGLSVGWNLATLTEPAIAAVRQILERNGGAANRVFELHHGTLVLLRCQMLGRRGQLSFDGSRRKRNGK